MIWIEIGNRMMMVMAIIQPKWLLATNQKVIISKAIYEQT